MTLRGVSAEKAVTLSKNFKSIQDLVAKLDLCSGIDAQVKLITDCSEGVFRRQFGKALAKQIVNSLM